MGPDYKPLPSSHGRSTESGHNSTQPSATAHAVTASLWVAFWIVCSVSIIIVNKHVMTFSGFNFPFSLALWHMFLGTVTSRAAMQAMRMPDTLREHATPALYFQVGMIGVLFAATLVTGNAALRMLTVPTVQMLKVCWGFAGASLGLLCRAQQAHAQISTALQSFCHHHNVATITIPNTSL